MKKYRVTIEFEVFTDEDESKVAAAADSAFDTSYFTHYYPTMVIENEDITVDEEADSEAEEVDKYEAEEFACARKELTKQLARQAKRSGN